MVQAILAEQNRITVDQEIKYREHLTMLDEGLSDLKALDQQIQRTVQSTLPLTKQKVNLQLASYQAGKANLSDVIETRQALLNQRFTPHRFTTTASNYQSPALFFFCRTDLKPC